MVVAPPCVASRLAASTVLALLLLAGHGTTVPARAEAPFLTLASTTSPESSGLYAKLLPLFREATGIEVRVVAVGTGQALRLARAGDADLALVHDRPSEEAFVAEGHGIERVVVMANDFVLVGPTSDPAGIGGMRDAVAALRRIAETRAAFVSRGDDSGTHKAELRLWQAAGIDPRPESGTWYREAGRGMGGTLNTANAMPAYALSDRGSWIAFRNRSDLALLVENDPRLENVYTAIVVDPASHPDAKADLARRFVDWLASEPTQAAIAAFRVDGEQLFFPRAVPAAKDEAVSPGR